MKKSKNDFNVKVLYYGSGFTKFELLEPLSFTLSDGEVITVPSGILIDGRSSPGFLKFLFPSWGKAAKAWILHDYLYIIDYKREELGAFKAQKLADKEMLYAANYLNPGKANSWSFWENYLSYIAVRLFGARVYKS